MIYHQYFYDFYDDLPDISILIHSQKESWHVEGLLEQSMLFSLNHLDLREALRRRFLNLRVTWGIGCSNGAMNTTRVQEESGNAPEQKAMQEAFRANFNLYDIPEILATPCCSQIVVIKELIQSVPREQYQHHIQWLLRTSLDDSISGRVWEHMWQYLFLKQAVDCPIEHKAYCRLYHICFGGRRQYDEWIELNDGRQKLEGEISDLLNRGTNEDIDQSEEQETDREGEPNDGDEDEEKPKKQKKKKKKAKNKKSKAAEKARLKRRKWLEDELASIRETIRVQREVAMVRGAVEANRIAEGEFLYGNDLEPGVDPIPVN